MQAPRYLGWLQGSAVVPTFKRIIIMLLTKSNRNNSVSFRFFHNFSKSLVSSFFFYRPVLCYLNFEFKIKKNPLKRIFSSTTEYFSLPAYVRITQPDQIYLCSSSKSRQIQNKRCVTYQGRHLQGKNAKSLLAISILTRNSCQCKLGTHSVMRISLSNTVRPVRIITLVLTKSRVYAIPYYQGITTSTELTIRKKFNTIQKDTVLL